MTTKRPLSWFLTEKGRNFVFAFATGTGISLSVAKFVPQTFLINKYKEFVHYYNNGQPVQLSQELEERFQKCLDILQVPDLQRKLFVPFSVFGFDLFHAGSWSSKYGAIIGVPVHFSYKSLSDIEKDDIQVNHKKVDWTSEAGKNLAESLLLTEKEQEYALSREILSTQNQKMYLQSVYPFSSVFIAYTVTHYMNRRLNLYVAPLGIRALFYALTGTFCGGLYFFMQDYTEVYYETAVDKKLSELNQDFIESGVTFYDKLMKRNRALRELMGKEGENKYSKLGNENFGVRQPRVALMHRKQFFEEKLKDINAFAE